MKREYKLSALALMIISSLVLKSYSQPSQGVRGVAKDDEITVNVQRALLDRKELRQLDIKVATRKGDVLLSGAVKNRLQLEHLKELVYSVEGVQAIHDHVSIKSQKVF